MKNFGLHTPEEGLFISGNAKMSEFQAAMGICNLRHIDFEIKKRKEAAYCYRARLGNIKGVILCPEQENVESNYAYFPVVFDNYKYNRNEIFEKLKENDIIARKYFYPLINGFECYKSFDTASEEKTPVAKHIAENILTLPMLKDLKIEDVDRICDITLK